MYVTRYRKNKEKKKTHKILIVEYDDDDKNDIKKFSRLQVSDFTGLLFEYGICRKIIKIKNVCCSFQLGIKSILHIFLYLYYLIQ